MSDLKLVSNNKNPKRSISDLDKAKESYWSVINLANDNKMTVNYCDKNEFLTILKMSINILTETFSELKNSVEQDFEPKLTLIKGNENNV